MNYNLLKADAQQFINDHLNDADVTQISLSRSAFEGIASRELAEQIDSKKRCQKKLPLWYTIPMIYYPPKLAIEQCSSETTAHYKAGLIKGDSVVDMTGGFGVDSYYFARFAKKVVHCEVNEHLSKIAAYNSSVLNVKNIRFETQDSIEYIKSQHQTYDTIYVDPSRRIKTQKVFLLSDCEPDVVGNLDLLLEHAGRILIKSSPLLDISSGLKELKYVSQVHILSIKNDCKELLWVIDKGFSGEPTYKCIAFHDKAIREFSFIMAEEKRLAIEHYSSPAAGEYVYEPDASLLKAGCFKLLADRFNIRKIAANTHLYLSDQLLPDFIGRIYQAEIVMSYKEFSKLNFKKANVITRNFPISPSDIKRKHKITEGGDLYLLFTSNQSKQLVVIQAIRI